RLEPTAGESRARQLRVVVVAAHDARTAKPELTDGAFGQGALAFHVLGIEHGHLVIAERAAAGDELRGIGVAFGRACLLLARELARGDGFDPQPLSEPAERDRECCFGHSVAGDECLAPEALRREGARERLERLGPDRLCSAAGYAPAREVDPLELPF